MMRKLFLTLTFLILGVSLVKSQTYTPPLFDDPNAPMIKFEKTTYDFGTIKKGADGTYEFKFTNTGKTPLTISDAVASCNCTVPSKPTKPIMPGKTGVIKVKYDTKKIGVFNKDITVTSNAKTSTVVLTIKGNVLDE